MKNRGLLIPFIFMLALSLPAASGARAAQDRQKGAEFIFASDTAERFIGDFFSDRAPGELARLALLSGQEADFTITIEEYRKVFIEKGVRGRRHVRASVTKTVEPEQDKAYCYLTVRLSPPMLSSSLRCVYALRTTCVRKDGEWKIMPEADESGVVPEPFSVLYTKKLKRGESLHSAQRQAAEIISLDAEKLMALARYIQNLLQKAEIEYAYGDLAAAADTYRNILSMAPENERARKGLRDCRQAGTATADAAAAPAITSSRIAPPAGDFITKADFNRKIDELMGKISKTQSAAPGKDTGDFVTKEEIDRKLETIIIKLQEDRPAKTADTAAKATQSSQGQTDDEHAAMVARIIALGEKFFQDSQYRRAIVEFQKADTVDPGNKRAAVMINLCRKALETE